MDDSSKNYVKSIVEAILFVSEKPVTIEQFKEVVVGSSSSDIKEQLDVLRGEYKSRESGMIIMEIAEGFQMLSSPQYVNSVRDFFKTRHKEKLSKPALETLAIIAYKEPVSRSDIEMIRGVNSDGVVAHLFSKELIKIVGRKEVPGRPYLYGTTKQFLEYFGLKSLADLPKMSEFVSMQSETEQVPSKAIVALPIDEVIANTAEPEILNAEAQSEKVESLELPAENSNTI